MKSSGLVLGFSLLLGCVSPEEDGLVVGGGADAFGPTSDCVIPGRTTRENAQGCFADALQGASTLAVSQPAAVNVFNNSSLDICDVLRPLFGSNDPTGAALFVGGIGALSVGLTDVGGGVDQVWDLYHYQMINSVLAGYGLSSFTFGPNMQAFAGLAFNFREDAGDWYGWFQGGGVTFMVPEVPFLSLGFGLFAAAADRNGDGFPGFPTMGPNGFPTGTYGVAGIAQISLPVSQWRLPAWVNRAAAGTYIRRTAGLGLNPTFYSPNQELMQTAYDNIRGLIDTRATPIGRITGPAEGGFGSTFDGSQQWFPSTNCWQGDNVCALEFTGGYHFSRGARMSAAMALLMPGQGSAVWQTMIVIPAAYGALRSAGGALGQALEEVCPSGW